MIRLNEIEFNLLTSLLARPLLVTYGLDRNKQVQTIRNFIKKISPSLTSKSINIHNNYLQEFLYNPKSSNNDSDLTSDNENHFLDHLDKAKNDQNNIYIYLLRNLEKEWSYNYLHAYLDAIITDNQLSIWESNTNLDKQLSISEPNANSEIKKIKTLLKVDINTKEKLSSNYEFDEGSVIINWHKVTSETNFTDFHKEIFKKTIDKYLNDNNKEELLLQVTSITTIEDLKKLGFIIYNKDKLNFNIEWWLKFYMKKEWWKTKTNYFYYKGYVIQTMLSYDSRLSKIKTLLKFLGKKEISSFYINFLTIDKSKKEYKESKAEKPKENYEYSDLWSYIKIPNNFFVVCTTKELKNIDSEIREVSSILEIKEDKIFKNNNPKIDILNKSDIQIKNIINLLNFKEQIDIKNDLLTYWKSITEVFKLLENQYDTLPSKTIKDSLKFINIWKEILKNSNIYNLEEKLIPLAFKQIIIPTLFLELKVLSSESSFIVEHPLLKKYKNEFTFEKESNKSNNELIENKNNLNNKVKIIDDNIFEKLWENTWIEYNKKSGSIKYYVDKKEWNEIIKIETIHELDETKDIQKFIKILLDNHWNPVLRSTFEKLWLTNEIVSKKYTNLKRKNSIWKFLEKYIDNKRGYKIF